MANNDGRVIDMSRRNFIVPFISAKAQKTFNRAAPIILGRVQS
jgi:hypothetical protein